MYESSKISPFLFYSSKIIYFLVCLGLSGLTLYLFSYSYDSFTQQLATYYHQLHKLEKFRQEILTPFRFRAIRWGTACFGLFFWGGLFCFHNWASFILTRLSIQGKAIFQLVFIPFQIIQQLSGFRLILFIGPLIILLLTRLYLAWIFPPMEDEVFSYVFFVEKGGFVAASYYPGPNNHILFSLLSVCIHNLFGNFFPEPVFSLRLVSIFFSTLTPLLLFGWFQHYFNFYKALFGVLLFQSLSPVFLYSFLGRGYSLQVFCVLVCSITITQLLQNPHKKGIPILFIISAVAGFYTLPTFLYPFLSFFLVVIWHRVTTHKSILNYLFYFFCVLFFTGVLYLPVIVLNGIRALLNNNWIKALPWQEFYNQLPFYILDISIFYFDNYKYIGLLVFTITLLVLGRVYIKANTSLRWLVLLSFSFFLIPLLIVPLQHVLPFPRIWTYLSIAFIINILLTSSSISKLYRLSFVSGSVLLLLSFYLTFSSYRFTYVTPSYQAFAKKAAKQPVHFIYCSESTYYVYLQYEFLKQYKNPLIQTHSFSLSSSYDMIIFPKKSSSSITSSIKNYHIHYQDSQVIVFSKQD